MMMIIVILLSLAGGFVGKSFACPEPVISTNYSKDGAPILLNFMNVQGLRLRAYGWKVYPSRAVVVGIHGLQSHCRFEFLRNVLPPQQEKGRDGDASRRVSWWSIFDRDNDQELDQELTNCEYNGSWVEIMNKQNISFWGFDLQGHGDSQGWEGKRGNVRRFDDYAEDVISLLNVLHQKILEDNQNPLPPIFLMATSMGGAICMRTIELMGQRNSLLFQPATEAPSILKDESDENTEFLSSPLYSTDITDSDSCSSYSPPYVKGCILLSPMLSLENIRTSLVNRLLYPFSAIFDYLFPHMPISSVEPDNLFPLMDKMKRLDKLVLKGKLPLRLYLESLKTSSVSLRDIGYIPKLLSVLFVHSELDPMGEFRGAQNFLSEMHHVADKELWPQRDMWHNLIMEHRNEVLCQSVLQWIDLRINVNNEKREEEEKEVEKTEQKQES